MLLTLGPSWGPQTFMIRGLDQRPRDQLERLEPPRLSSLCQGTTEAPNSAEKKLKLHKRDKVIPALSRSCLLPHFIFQWKIIASSRLVRPRVTAKTISLDPWSYRRGLDWLLVQLDLKEWFWAIASCGMVLSDSVSRDVIERWYPFVR